MKSQLAKELSKLGQARGLAIEKSAYARRYIVRDIKTGAIIPAPDGSGRFTSKEAREFLEGLSETSTPTGGAGDDQGLSRLQ